MIGSRLVENLVVRADPENLTERGYVHERQALRRDGDVTSMGTLLQQIGVELGGIGRKKLGEHTTIVRDAALACASVRVCPLTAPTAWRDPEIESSARHVRLDSLSLMLLVAVALAGGACVGRWWVLVIPLALGGALVGLLGAQGHSLDDTPIGFAVVIATVAIGIGVLVRPSLARRLR